MTKQVDLAPLFMREFELCRVGENDVVGVLSDPGSRSEYVAAASTAAASLGASVFTVAVPQLGWQVPTPIRGMAAGAPALLEGSPVAAAVFAGLSRATFIADVTSETIIHVPIRDQLRKEGVRILTIHEPPDVLERMFPSDEARRLTEAISERVAGGTTLRVTSAAGTDINYKLDGTTPFAQYGYADEPGRWDHWPSALATVYPLDDVAEGVVVLQPGDLVFPFKRYVAETATLTVERGYVTAIDGGLDAELIDGYLKSWEEPEVYAVSHVGLGGHPSAQWSALEFYDKTETIGMDARSFPGGFIFSTGPNRYTGRLVEAHLDLPLRGCTVEIDGEVVLDAGQLTLGAGAS